MREPSQPTLAPVLCHNSAVWQHPIGRVRLIGWLEAVSFLLLLGVAMPLKYGAGLPAAVTAAGLVHGVLFLALCYTTLLTASEVKWSIGKAASVIGAALLPFGPFLIDARLKREQQAGGSPAA